MDDITLVEDGISNIEVASVNFDQWILTVALRAYAADQSVKGMVHVIFKGVRGFRYLDEGDMLAYPFPENCTTKYIHVINQKGWSQQETEFGNIVTPGHKEYLVATDHECICILAHQEPVVIKDI